MQNISARTPLIREASLMALVALGTPDKGSTIRFMTRYTTTPKSMPLITGRLVKITKLRAPT